MRTVYLVRHGVTDWNQGKIVIGRTDIPLNEDGRAQAQKLAEELADVKFDHCYVSPLSRAQETAKIVQAGNKAGFEMTTDARLVELFAGNYEGKLESEWQYKEDGSRETDMDILARAKDFCDNVLETAPDGSTILVVSHFDLLRNLQHCILCKDGPVDFSQGLGNCEYAKILY